MKTLFVLLLLLSRHISTPWQQTVECDLIELNHTVRDNYNLRQWVFWVRDREGQLHVATWEYESKAFDGPPRFNHLTQRYELLLLLERKILRIKAPAYKETKTTEDPEREDLKYLSTGHRRRLW